MLLHELEEELALLALLGELVEEEEDDGQEPLEPEGEGGGPETYPIKERNRSQILVRKPKNPVGGEVGGDEPEGQEE